MPSLTFYRLARNPYVWDNMRVEILSKHEELTNESIKDTKFMLHMLNESQNCTFLM